MATSVVTFKEDGKHNEKKTYLLSRSYFVHFIVSAADYLDRGRGYAHDLSLGEKTLPSR